MDSVKASGVVPGAENLEGAVRTGQLSVSPSPPRNPTSDLRVTAVSDFDQESNPADDRDEGVDGGSVTRPILAVIVATAVLYLGKDILLPLAMASILAVGFSPITSRLETLVGRFASAALVVVLAISTVGAIGFFLTVELTSVAVELAGYSNNIAAKLTSLQGVLRHGCRPANPASRMSSGSWKNRSATGHAPAPDGASAGGAAGHE